MSFVFVSIRLICQLLCISSNREPFNKRILFMPIFILIERLFNQMQIPLSEPSQYLVANRVT